MRDWPKVGGLEEDIPTSPLVDDPANCQQSRNPYIRAAVTCTFTTTHAQWLIFFTGGLRQGLSTVWHDGRPAKKFLWLPRPNLVVLLKRVTYERMLL